MASPKKTKGKTTPKPELEGDFMDHRYHCENPICQIIPTCPDKKPNIIKEMRPKKGTNLDYHISQTDCKVDAGETKIHLQQTSAEYSPATNVPIAVKKKIKYNSHGRGPVWEFLEEKIARKIEEQQAIYRAEFASYMARKKKERRAKGGKMHDMLLRRVGPDWYQELSPKQLATVDCLQECILKDITEKNITHTKENIASLGLVLRPNHNHLKVALRFCCKCPVEFLLILYQVMNPKRTEYSLNDRLLLSAVVHLTMKTTLKELHIRIPSPPRKAILAKAIEKKPAKKIKCPSPYLEPYTFKPEPRKHSGMYENTHRQYPESPYFSYLAELILQPQFVDEDINLLEETSRSSAFALEYEILEECKLAQAIYNKLAKDNNAPSLYIPNIYPTCIRVAAKLDEGQTIVPESYSDTSDSINQTDVSIAVNLNITSEYGADAQLSKVTYGCSVTIDETLQPTYRQRIERLQSRFIRRRTKFVLGGVGMGRDGKPVYIISAVLPRGPCDCLTQTDNLDDASAEPENLDTIEKVQEKLRSHEQTFVIGGVTKGPDGLPVYIITAVLASSDCICGPSSDEPKAVEKQGSLPPEQLESNLSEIKQQHICKRCRNIQNAQENVKKRRCIIGGVTIGPNKKPVYIISGIFPRQPKICPNCAAIKNVQDNLTQMKRKFIISGVTKGPDKLPVYIISGLAPQPLHICPDCKKKQSPPKTLYDKALQADYKDAIQETEKKLKQMQQEFVVGNVLTGSEGDSVYVVASNRCNCEECSAKRKSKSSDEEEMYREVIEEAQRQLRNMRQKFVIGGVTKGPDNKPVYIISDVLPTCNCTEDETGYQKIIEESQENLRSVSGRLLPDVFVISDETKQLDYRRAMIEAQKNLLNSKQEFVVGGVAKGPDNKPVYILSDVLSPRCTCHDNKMLDETSMPMYREAIEEAQIDLMLHEPKFEIGGVTKGPDNKPVFILSSAHPKPKEFIDETKFPKYRRVIEEVQRNLVRTKRKFILGGVTLGRDRNPLYVISGIAPRAKRMCRKCMLTEQAQKKLIRNKECFIIGGVAKGPTYIIQGISPKSRRVCKKCLLIQQAQQNLMNLKQTFIIGGVTKGPDQNPVYILSGIRPKKPHVCQNCKLKLKAFDEEAKYNQILERIQGNLEISKFILGGVSTGPDGYPVYIITGVFSQQMPLEPSLPTCKCTGDKIDEKDETREPKYRKKIKKCQKKLAKQKLIVGGVTKGPDGKPVYIISSVFRSKCRCAEEAQKKLALNKELEFAKKVKQVQRNLMILKQKFVLSGVTIGKDGNPIYIISCVFPKEECPCDRKQRENLVEIDQIEKEREDYDNHMKLALLTDEEKLLEVKRRPPDTCVCKNEAEKTIETNIRLRCQCPKCREELERTRKLFIIAGTTVEKGDPIHIISGIQAGKSCDCLVRYRKKVERYENQKARLEAKTDLKSLPKKYTVSGVTSGPDGKPIYILSGVAPEKECACAQEFYERQQREARAPILDPDSPKFIISGIQEQPNENVYIVSGVVPIPDCDCMAVYDAFMEKHSPCLKLYDRYVEKVQKDVQEYMEEIEEDERYKELDECVCEEKSLSPLCAYNRMEEDEDKYKTIIPEPEISTDTSDYELSRTTATNCVEDQDEDVFLTVEIENPNKDCMCLDEESSQNESTDSKLAEEETKTEQLSRVKKQLKRYIILSKIPCNLNAQLCILRDALETLAEDGFPLAKLPECYALPHFKLWMQMRCGKYWTKKEKHAFMQESKIEWNHTNRCSKMSTHPSLPISLAAIKKLTWRDAKYCKNMAETAKEKFIRQEKQYRVGDGREFFSTTFDYEFPTPTFRDCFFAYVPSKEEDTFLWKVWRGGEKKDRTRKS